MSTQQPDPQLSVEPSSREAEDAAPGRWPGVRWYAEAVRAERRPAAGAAAPIDFLGLFLHRALAGARRLDSRA